MTKLLGTTLTTLMCLACLQTKAQNKISKAETDKNRIQQFTDSIRNLPPLEITAVRISQQAPFAKSNISSLLIKENNMGQDLPMLLQNTPSVVVNADAGMGIGYTGLRIRGTDATRINVTLNGIPYNDAESMGTYFVDLPDFSSSVGSIQIQRGVGTSTNGAGSFGATINLATNIYHPSAYGSLQSSVGSFHSLKNTLLFGTGLINQHITIDGRISKISSDGYIDRAKSNLKSLYLSATYWGDDHSSLRFNVFTGYEKTYQAWYGVPEEQLQNNRTFNPAGMEKTDAPYNNQTDNYQQTHYQLFYNKTINTHWKWNTAFFLTNGKGYYEEYKAGVNPADYGIHSLGNNPIDLVRRKWLDNHFYGQIASFQYENKKDQVILGGGWTTYDGGHYGTLPYLIATENNVDYKYYNNNAIKKDMNLYTKWTRQINTQVSSFIDLQYRHVQHNMNGFDSNPDLFVSRSFDFINPKMGLKYVSSQTTYYTSISVANKEPNRDDFEAGKTQQPIAEQLIDYEAGLEQKWQGFTWGANLYFMDYHNQLVLTGKINDVGSYTRTNVPKSYRAGIELEMAWKINAYLSNSANITWSQNKIKDFTEYYDDYDNGGQVAIPHHNTAITLSPDLIASNTLNFTPFASWTFALTSKYVSKQYLDNTQNEARKLGDYCTQDLRIAYQLLKQKHFEVKLQGYINNITNVLYTPSGYSYSYKWGGDVTTSNNYYPMAGRNYWLSILIDWK